MKPVQNQRIELHLDWDGRRVRAVRIQSSRLLQVGCLFQGCTADQVLAIMPNLFVVCGKAHQAAARMALGGDVCAVTLSDALAICGENLREHLLAFHSAWPALLGWTANPMQLMFVMQATAQLGGVDGATALSQLSGHIQRHLLAMPPQVFVSLDAAQQMQWRAEAPSLAARILRALDDWPVPELPQSVPTLSGADAQAVAERLRMAESDWTAAPELDDGCRFTGPLARQPQWQEPRDGWNPLQRLLYARLLTLVNDLSQARALLAGVAGVSLETAGGVGHVQTARGDLFHWARVVDGRVERYALVAPTEWNFHPCGLLAQWLGRVEGCQRQAVERQARAMVTALDPCVAFEVSIGDQWVEAAHA